MSWLQQLKLVGMQKLFASSERKRWIAKLPVWAGLQGCLWISYGFGDYE